MTSLKQRVVSLASNSGVISTVQVAAQNTLQNGWSILLPTAEERARALSSLLSNGGKFSTVFNAIRALCVTILKYYTSLENSVDPDQLASYEASCSGSTLFFIYYKKNSEYDQEIAQSQTADKPKAQRERATQQS